MGNIASAGDGSGIFILNEIGTATLLNNIISGNTSSGHGGAIFIYVGDRPVILSANTIIGNASPSSSVYWGGSAGSRATNNNFFANDAPYLVYNGLLNTAPDVNLENNWWGTTDDAEVQAKIYDWFDDPTKGFVDYTPFLTAPNTGAPVSPPLGLAATEDASALTIDLSWSTNPESDVVGYRVYYGTGDSGFPSLGTGAASGDSPIDVGSVTSYPLSSLTP